MVLRWVTSMKFADVRLARRRHCTPAQLALAWVLAQGEDLVPIPGTKRRSYLEENVATLAIELAPTDLAAVGQSIPSARPPG
jgi:aryl-alcohol dehydrogenase-like predicted oxidoreductase